MTTNEHKDLSIEELINFNKTLGPRMEISIDQMIPIQQTVKILKLFREMNCSMNAENYVVNMSLIEYKKFLEFKEFLDFKKHQL